MANPAKSAILSMLATPEPPELGPGPRAGVLSVAEINESFNQFVKGVRPGPDAGGLIRALILLWHDHLDEAHQISQDVETVDGSFVHGIMHRREPDYGNAKYWFHRAGRHPVLAELGKRATALLAAKGEDALRKKLAPHDLWDAAAYVDTCAEAASQPDNCSRDRLLRQLQQIETETLLEYFSNRQPTADQE